MIHGMIDLETLSTKPNATILTIGGVKFDPYSFTEPSQGMYFRVDVDSQTAMGRDVQQETIDWWATQPKEISEEALGDEDRIDLKYLIKQINKWSVGVDVFWCQGPLFDYDILQGKQIEKDDSEELEGQAGTYFEQLSNIQDMSARQSKGNQIYETILNVIKDSDKDEDEKRDDLGWLNKLSARHVGDNIQSTQHDFGENFIHKNNKIKQAHSLTASP